MGGYQRVHHHLGNRRVDFGFLRDEARHQSKFAGRNSVGRFHPEAVERFCHRLYRCDVLDPVGTGPARHDEPGWKAVEMRQRLTIHFVGNESCVLYRFRDRDAPDEIRRLVEDGFVGSVKYNLNRPFF